ncbi:MAG TPA: glycosyltransferase family 4 protein [Tepidiformaceae bacterium]|nr:glycosyltransferase family 4 protein [Tepidiformaceae bacterium]
MPAAPSAPTHAALEPLEQDGARQRPRALFLGKTYAGWRTRFLNLQAHIQQDGRLDASFREVTGWRPEGRLERMPWLPPAVTGRLRAVLDAAPFAAYPRPDVIWSSASEALLPYLWSQAPRLRRPLVLELDWTLAQQEQFAGPYFGRDSRQGASLAFARCRERAVWHTATAFVAWSRWARDSLLQQGVAEDRVRVIPPGVDLGWWSPGMTSRQDAPLRLLFVGGDFARKGGPELLAALAALPGGTCELDIVTPTAPAVPPGVRGHNLQANSVELRELYRNADLFILPTKAECLGIAAIEAMACALPVVMTDVGGARDIVVDGESGWLLQSPQDLGQALGAVLQDRERLKAMGLAARARAECLFDGTANDRRLVDLLLSLSGLRGGQDGRPARRPPADRP